jgi:hypothetical protein
MDGTYDLFIDGHHASRAGSYLLGSVWYEILFEENVIDNTYVPVEIDPAYARFLRRVAHRAVARVKKREKLE